MTTSPTADNQMQERVFAFLADPAQHPRCASDRYPCGIGVSRRRPRAEDQARGPLSLSRLFDAGEAQGRLRGRNHDQPPVRAANLSPRRSDHAKRRWIARDRRRGHAGRIRGRNDPLRREPDPRSSGGSRRRRIPISSTPLPTRSRPRMRPPHRQRQNPGSSRFRRSSPTIPQHSVPPPAFRRARSIASTEASRSAFSAVPRSVRATRQSRDLCGAAMAICIWRTSC